MFLANMAWAEPVTLTLHHFVPQEDPMHAEFLVPLAERIEDASDGALVIEIATDMSLGGVPPELIGQVADGTVDMVFTCPALPQIGFHAPKCLSCHF